MDKSEIEVVIDKESKAVIHSMAKLLRALREGLQNTYQSRTAELDAEDENLAQKLVMLSDSLEKLGPIAEAQLKLIDQKATELMAAGKVEESKAKAVEIETVKGALIETREKIDAARDRREAIVAEKKRIAHQVFDEVFRHFPGATHFVLEGYLALLDGIQGVCFSFQADTGTGGDPGPPHVAPLVTPWRFRALVPASLGKDQGLWQRAGRWLGFI